MKHWLKYARNSELESRNNRDMLVGWFGKFEGLVGFGEDVGFKGCFVVFLCAKTGHIGAVLGAIREGV